VKAVWSDFLPVSVRALLQQPILLRVVAADGQRLIGRLGMTAASRTVGSVRHGSEFIDEGLLKEHL
jgi:hypothetical protein